MCIVMLEWTHCEHIRFNQNSGSPLGGSKQSENCPTVHLLLVIGNALATCGCPYQGHLVYVLRRPRRGEWKVDPSALGRDESLSSWFRSLTQGMHPSRGLWAHDVGIAASKRRPLEVASATTSEYTSLAPKMPRNFACIFFDSLTLCRRLGDVRSASWSSEYTKQAVSMLLHTNFRQVSTLLVVIYCLYSPCASSSGLRVPVLRRLLQTQVRQLDGSGSPLRA